MIEMRDVSKQYRGKGSRGRSVTFDAVKQVSLTLRSDVRYALVGESGSGKSTLARLLMAIDPPTSGEILFDGASVWEMHPRELRKKRAEYQMVLQNASGSLDPRRSVYDSIAEPIRCLTNLDRSEEREKVLALAERMKLSAAQLERLPHELSGGQLKRVCMARAMSVSPNAFHEDGSVKDTLKTVTLGTGHYMYRGDRDGNIYTFVRTPHYWGEPPEVERFHVKVIPDNHARLLAFRNGEVDLLVGTRQISFDGFNEMKAAGYGALVSEGEANYSRFLAFDVSKAPFDDLNVRLAVSYAIDKMSIVQNIFAGIETKADSILDPALPYCDVQLVPRIYDRQQAIALLENAGWVDADGDGVREKDGVMLKGEILYIKGDPMIDDLILVLAAQLKEIGMEMKGNGMEKMAFHAEYAKGVAITLYQTYGNPWDPHTTISNMKPDLKNDYPAAQALALVKNGNDIIQRLNVTTDEKEIRKTYHFVLSEIHDKATLLPISYTRELALHNTDKIKGYTFYAGQPSHFNVAGIKLK